MMTEGMIHPMLAAMAPGMPAIFMQGMQAGVCAMLADVILSLFSNILKKDMVLHIVLTVLCFILVRYTDLSVFVLLLICIAVSVVKTFVTQRKEAER